MSSLQMQIGFNLLAIALLMVGLIYSNKARRAWADRAHQAEATVNFQKIEILTLRDENAKLRGQVQGVLQQKGIG